MQMKDSIYDMLHEIFSTTLFLLVEIPDCIIQGFGKEKNHFTIVKNVTTNDIYNSNENVIFVTYYIKKMGFNMIIAYEPPGVTKNT